MTSNLLWKPNQDQIDHRNLTAFAKQHGFAPDDYPALHQWSITSRDSFWSSVWSFCDIVGDPGSDVLINPDSFPGSRWFPEASLNFSENLLRYDDARTALVAITEQGERVTMTYAELRVEVAKFAAELEERGVEPGDRVAGWMPNVIETVIAMLGTTAIGAVWSSCSPDFGFEGALDRFGQIEPKILVACDGYAYNGKTFDITGNVDDVAETIASIDHVIWCSLLGLRDDGFHEIRQRSETVPNFRRLPFDHPLFIMYSSGTTGKPKCIVHGAGGTLIQHVKEHAFHCDLRRDDVLFFFTTCGWMMWNWLVSGLATGCTLVLYEGSPFHPTSSVLIDLIEQESISLFGVGAKYISSIEKAGIEPRSSHDLSSLRAIFSTGSPLTHESFRYVYKRFKPEIWLASIAGGTDLISCFVLGNPWGGVYEGEIQAPGLGMAVDVFNDDGSSITDAKGELVCTRSFPSTPIGFWNDSDNVLLRSAYFDRYPEVWAHGDFAERISETGGFVIHGRSDAVLNPGGVRIGTAEIYRQVESIGAIKEALCIGQEWDGDTRVVLFVVMQNDTSFTEETAAMIRTKIRENASPRHVPARIVAVPDIPRTLSGKIAEIAVREVVHSRPVKNTSALANPETLLYFESLKELQS